MNALKTLICVIMTVPTPLAPTRVAADLATSSIKMDTLVMVKILWH